MGSLNVGGAETMIVNIFRHIDRDRFDFSFLVNGSRGGYYEKAVQQLGGSVDYLPKRRQSLPDHYCELYRIIKRGRYHVIHFHTQNAFLTSTQLIAARLAGAKCIAVHSHNTRDWRKQSLLLVHKLCRHYLYRHTDIRLACSRAAAIWLFGTERNVEVFPLPIVCENFLFSESKYRNLRKDAQWEGKAVYVHVGRFSDVKNHKFLLEVFAQIKRLEKDSILILAGDGELREEIKNQIRELNLEKDVMLCGVVADVYNKLIMSDGFIFPSKYEGFPTSVLEAQAAGLPCYISDTITPEIKITDLVTMISLEASAEDWAKTIVIDQKRERTNRALYNQIIAQQYDIDAVTGRLMSLYKEAAEKI